MKKIFITGILIISICQPPQIHTNVPVDTLPVIPRPVTAKLFEGVFDLKSVQGISLKNESEEERSVAEFFREYLKPIRALSISNSRDDMTNNILISLDGDVNIADEGYHLSIGVNQFIELTASSQAGLFYGFQTFRQLCPPELEKGEMPKNTRIQNYKIVDYPQFSYRGMQLDVSRHFFDVDFIKTYIDMIALHKMNVFHWHLTDDNGWRIEIDQYPELTSKSAWRVDREHEPWKEWSPIQTGEKSTYGGYYTKEDIREIVEYAADRHIMVIPEIEMPGHTSEVFAAFPDLSCKGDTLNVVPGSYWPNVDIFCAGNDNVFTFIKNVLAEVIDMFPGPYVHIGGDEAQKVNWKQCSKCQKRIQEEDLKDEHELQSWFIQRIEKFILSKNKKLVGWDEILEGGLAKSATVMSWRGMKGGIESAKAGHDVIMCPTSHCYFDYYQANPETSPVAIGGYTTLKKVYSFNPLPEELSQEESKFVLGAQGNLWTEYVKTNDRAQYRVLPRMSALAEVVWSPKETRNYNNFYNRLLTVQKRFDVLGWTYAPGSFLITINADSESSGTQFKVELSSEKPVENIHYTLDGTEPKGSSKYYLNPFNISKTTTVKAALFINNKQAGKTTEKTFYFHKGIGKPIAYNIPYAPLYSSVGDIALADGLTGTTHHSDGYWQGWEAENLDIIIDLGKVEYISRISAGFLESQSSWIFLPKKITVSFSADGKSFNNEQSIDITDGEKYGAPNRVLVELNNIDAKGRFVKVLASNRKVCPDWHAGAGEKAWIFADELIVD